MKLAKKQNKQQQGKQFCAHSVCLYFLFLGEEYFLVTDVAIYFSRMLNKDPSEFLMKGWEKKNLNPDGILFNLAF